MGDLAREACRGVPREPGAGEGPEFGENIVLDEGYVLDLAVESRDKAELCFGASVCLDKRQSMGRHGRVRLCRSTPGSCQILPA
jgi:hypothetical protein